MNSKRPSEAHIDGPGDPLGRPRIDDEGVDLTLIRWSLSLTPLERLQALEDQIRFVEAIEASRRG